MIRTVTTRDEFALCAEINHGVNPDHPVTADQLAGSGGTALLHSAGGYAYVDRSSVPGSAFAMVRVRPESRRRGIGGELLAAASRHAGSLDATTMWGRVSEFDEPSLRFVQRRGFVEITRDMEILLDLTSADGAIADGIVELTDEHLCGAYDVVAEALPEVAVPQHAEAPPFDEWLEHELYLSAVAFVALDGDKVAGYARLYHMPALPDRLENGLTAVLRSHRRRGIATALKRAQIAWAVAHGFRELVTSSVAENDAMRAVNDRFGYRPLPALIVVEGPVR